MFGFVFFCWFFARSLPRSRVCVLLFRSCCIFSAQKSNPSTLKQQKHLQTFTTLKSPKSYKKKFTLPFIRHCFLGFLSFAVPAESKNQGEDGVPEEADLQTPHPCLLSSEVRLPSLSIPPSLGNASCHSLLLSHERAVAPNITSRKSLIGPGPFQVGEPAA